MAVACHDGHQHHTGVIPGTRQFPGGVNKLTTVITTKFHASTHLDAPSHVLDGGMNVDQIPLERCYGTGVIVDMRHKKKWDIITAEDLEDAKPKIREGDFVVVNTGWHKYYLTRHYVFMNHFPGFYDSAGKWFVKKKIKAVAIDGGAMDSPLAHRPLDKYAPWLYQEYLEETGKDANKEFPFMSHAIWLWQRPVSLASRSLEVRLTRSPGNGAPWRRFLSAMRAEKLPLSAWWRLSENRLGKAGTRQG